MKKRFLAILIAAAAAISGTVGLTACNKDKDNSKPKWGSEYSYTTAYAQAQELGYAGTLEEFITMISGKDGKDGVNGTNGKDGVGIKGIEINSNNELVITWTTDETTNIGIVPPCKHKFGEWEAGIKETCYSIGFNYRICSVCGYKDYEFIPPHKHTYAEEWLSNATTHWHEATCEHTDIKGDEGAHKFNSNYICETCGYDGAISVVGVELNPYSTTIEVGETMTLRATITPENATNKNRTWESSDPEIASVENGVITAHKIGTAMITVTTEDGGFQATCEVIVAPLIKTPVQGTIITKFGLIRNITTGVWETHRGIDISADEGTPVIAARDGYVESIVLNDELDGSSITIVHKNGTKTHYGFIEVDPQLKVGDKVKQGNVIGTVGAADGKEQHLAAHLHFELHINGEAVDPEQYIDFGNN